jgi:hypothetical protein
VERHRVDVVLADGLWWRGKAQSQLPTVSRRRRRTVVVGDYALAKIGGRLGAGKHKQGSRKFARGSVRAIGARWWLSTVIRGSPERRSGGGGNWSSGCARRRGKDANDVSVIS